MKNCKNILTKNERIKNEIKRNRKNLAQYI